MRARLIAPALAIAGFVLTLEVVSWQNRPMPPATGWRSNLLVTPVARTASTVPQAAPALVTDPQPQAPAPLPVAAAVAPPEALPSAQAPDPETTLPVYGEDDDARDDGSGNDRPRRK